MTPELTFALRRPGTRSIVTACGCPSTSTIRNGLRDLLASSVACSIVSPTY